MTFALSDIIKCTYPAGQKPNNDQLKAIQHIKGPLLIVAGPGSGKTKTLITRALNLLLCQQVRPENILLCTFTDKAARQLRDRLNAGLNKCGANNIDIHEMTIGTIHSVCQKIIDEYPNEAGIGVYSKTRGLGRGYLVLDEIKRSFFMMEHFEKIFGNKVASNDRYLGLWKGFWDAIEGSQEYFDKITEEFIDLDELVRSDNQMVQVIGKAMRAYRRLQIEEGKIDFSHLEWLAYDLLLNHAAARSEFQNKFEYVMVDEYQDTNYIQEQLIFALANKDKNIGVVGDVDQSIYRFRGATTQNILEFPKRVGKSDLKPINLGTNYRSNQAIIDLYQGYRDEINWDNCRFPLNVTADRDLEVKRPKYVSTIKIEEVDADTEGRSVADFIVTLKQKEIIKDYNQVAILLYSVRQHHSGQYINAIRALRESGERIDVYAPRARLYFERPEIMFALAGLYSVNPVGLSTIQGGYPGQETESVKDYLGRCIRLFKTQADTNGHSAFIGKIKKLNDEIGRLKKTSGKPKKTLLEYFYHVINTEFFERWLDDELPARHLAQLTQLIETFSDYYRKEWITGKNADLTWDRFFNSFLRMLFDGGLNEYENEEEAFPSGAVQVMTFHQSKGLEFPVVIVGDLHAQVTTGKKVDDLLSGFYHRSMIEPRTRITDFDKRRLYYVAFSRAKDFLVLTGHNDLGPNVAKRKTHFCGGLSQCQNWHDVMQQGDYVRPPVEEGDAEMLKPVFGFTSHISAYERCPQQFRLQKLYGFVPKRSEQLWMGNVVHNTLKDIHDHVLKNKSGDLTDEIVEEYLNNNIANLKRRGIVAREPAGGRHPHEVAKECILRYVRLNKNKLAHCKWAEKEILVDEHDFSLTGVIDLLIHDDSDKVELVDFKAGRKQNNLPYREGYADQVRLYCKQVEPKLGKYPDEAYLYWVTEPEGTEPRDIVDTDPRLLDGTRERVLQVAHKIINKDFPRLPKRDEDLCGICEFTERCWS